MAEIGLHKDVKRHLSRREQFMLAAGGVVLVGVLLHQLVVDPFLSRKKRIERSLQHKAASVVEMKLLQEQYMQVSANKSDIMGRLKVRAPGFSLFTFVEAQIESARLKQRVTSINPTLSDYQEGIRRSVIDLKIEGVVLPQLVDFLASIESFNEVVFIDRIVVQSSSAEGGLLDTTLSVVTFETEPAS
jgi:hypothetical protein